MVVFACQGFKNLHVFMASNSEEKFSFVKHDSFFLYVSSPEIFQVHSFATQSPEFRS
jgi:hypothetical protein